MKKVLESGVIEGAGNKKAIYDFYSLPFVVEENEEMEFIYKNHLTGEEKKLMDRSVSNNVDGFTSQFENYLIENSPYAIIEKTIDNKETLKKTTYIVNVNSREKYIKNIEVEIDKIIDESYRRLNNKYFYTGEENTIYSISNLDGTIKKLMIKNGEIEEVEYDKINNNLSSTYNKFDIYSNGLETRIIYDVVNPITSEIENQWSYKVTSKEHEKIFDLKKKIGSYIYKLKILPNNLMLFKINEEYTLVKFEKDGIRLVYKFDFSDVGNWENEHIRDARISSNKDVSEILVKLVIGNYKTKEISEEFKRYEIEIGDK